MPQQLVEVVILIPLTEDQEVGDGTPHPAGRWSGFFDHCYRLFGALTIDRAPVNGMWRDPATGRPITDASRRITLAIPEAGLPRLRRLLQATAVVFRQKAIYLSVAGRVEFIENPRWPP